MGGIVLETISLLSLSYIISFIYSFFEYKPIKICMKSLKSLYNSITKKHISSHVSSASSTNSSSSSVSQMNPAHRSLRNHYSANNIEQAIEGLEDHIWNTSRATPEQRQERLQQISDLFEIYNLTLSSSTSNSTSSTNRLNSHSISTSRTRIKKKPVEKPIKKKLLSVRPFLRRKLAELVSLKTIRNEFGLMANSNRKGKGWKTHEKSMQEVRLQMLGPQGSTKQIECYVFNPETKKYDLQTIREAA